MFTHSLNVTMFSHCCEGILGHSVDIVLQGLLEPGLLKVTSVNSSLLYFHRIAQSCVMKIKLLVFLCLQYTYDTQSPLVMCVHSGQCVVEVPAESCVLALYVRSQQMYTGEAQQG